LVYGEEGLLHCRDLQIESIIQTIPYGYHARAMVNQLDEGKFNVVYVPKHFDITRWVGMTEKTQLSYWQLWQLWKDHGDSIYEMTVEQLYRSYPQYFLNVYENGSTCPEAKAEYPIQIPREMADDISSYYGLRDQAIGQYMARQSGLTYLSGYFTEEMKEVPVPWDSKEPQTGILVHGIRVASAEKARILHCDSARTLRQQLGDPLMVHEDIRKSVADEPHRLQLCSNFLFFLTSKLVELYNQLRKDRPREQLREKQGHLDYQLYWESGRRVESFPLYRKAVLAKKRDGKFILSQYALGGGKMQITGIDGTKAAISWTAEAVDFVEETGGASAEILIYTPYLSRDDDGEGMFANSYRRLVGEDRINLVIIQDKIHCIRRGDVVLPSIGVVISLNEAYGQQILAGLGLTEQEDGYFDVDVLNLEVILDGPTQIDPEEWQQVEWAYGGGLTLVTEGQSIYGAEDIRQMEEETGTIRSREEGWLSPLSRQTQESALHVLVKHPRTAIGIAKNGDLFVLVFSGRTRMSTGADYQEMCHIAKTLIPDVESMMNVDGGGSSVLGMTIDGHFMELSYPATSMSSCAGMVRKVNTVLCLEV
ncbi:MAG: phosphodiester glycosidase family protein, partial [Lachnospiraceae bacterium]|nr:phosphodiester glycosidase family protein [Lachnospiraceae bacterium]